MFQSWRYLTFVHWRYEPDKIQHLLPCGLSVDTYDGAAWVGLTPFLLQNLRLPHAPPLPWISQFPEMNVRTYVIGPDREPGIWFFTLEAARVIAVIGARLSYGLPYRWADMSVTPVGENVVYHSVRRAPFGPAHCEMAVRIGPQLSPASLERFFTARFRLYTVLMSRLAFAQIAHPPWPLYGAQLLNLDQNVVERSGVPTPEGAPMLIYSPGVDVRIERPHFVHKRGIKPVR